MVLPLEFRPLCWTVTTETGVSVAFCSKPFVHIPVTPITPAPASASVAPTPTSLLCNVGESWVGQTQGGGRSRCLAGWAGVCMT